MSMKETYTNRTPGIRINCPLTCGKGFLSIGQMLEHISKVHIRPEDVPPNHSSLLRPAVRKGIRKVPMSKMNEVRIVAQRTRLQSTEEKLRIISEILNGNKIEDIYFVDMSIYKDTVNAVINDPVGAASFVDSLKARLDDDDRCREWATRANIIKSFNVIGHFFSLVAQDGHFFHDGKWINKSVASESTRGDHSSLSIFSSIDALEQDTQSITSEGTTYAQSLPKSVDDTNAIGSICDNPPSPQVSRGLGQQTIGGFLGYPQFLEWNRDDMEQL